MGTIKVIKKPETVSYEDIHNIILSAHSILGDTFTLNTTNMTSDELKKTIGDSGICLTAYIDDKLAGTASICWEEINKWGYHEIFGVVRFVAVEAWAQGKGVGSALMHEIIAICLKNNKKSIVSMVFDNKAAKSLYMKNGYIPIRHYGAGHYCLTMANGIGWVKCYFYSSVSFLVSRVKHVLKKHK